MSSPARGADPVAPLLDEGLRPPQTLRDAAIARGLDARRREATTVVESILVAGRQLIERDAVLDFNVRELLTLAGVSNRAFYRHFETKETLVAALASEVYDDLVSALDAAIDGVTDAAVAIAAWVDGALSFAHDASLAARGRVFVAYEARLREEYPDLYRSVGRALTAQTAAIIAEGVAAGRFRPEAGIEQARLAVRLVIASLEHHVFQRTTPTDDERDAIVAMILGACT
jgi:AcrR family transcriptional regulator